MFGVLKFQFNIIDHGHDGVDVIRCSPWVVYPEGLQFLGFGEEIVILCGIPVILRYVDDVFARPIL